MTVPRLLVLPLLLALSLASPLYAQSPRPAAPNPLGHLSQTGTQQEGPEDETRRKFERDHEKKANEERFQKLKDDTEKLVQLSNELKEYVGKANEHTLSLDVIKKAEEIEKLAKSVKDRMKG